MSSFNHTQHSISKLARPALMIPMALYPTSPGLLPPIFSFGTGIGQVSFYGKLWQLGILTCKGPEKKPQSTAAGLSRSCPLLLQPSIPATPHPIQTQSLADRSLNAPYSLHFPCPSRMSHVFCQLWNLGILIKCFDGNQMRVLGPQ